MISDGISTIPEAFQQRARPGIMLVLTVLSINVFGDGCATRLTAAPDQIARSRAWESSLMARFLVRRLAVMWDLFAISLVTFLLFIVALPAATRGMLAGRLATPAEVHLISVHYGSISHLGQYFRR